jgi:hypothetical protein
MKAGDVEKALLAAIAAARNELAIEITANLIAATPVDTGHARANWVPSIGSPFGSEVGDGGAHDEGVVAILGAPLTADVFVSNNAPYIERLIAGSSSQAPPGWDVEAIDAAVQTVQQRYAQLNIDVTGSGASAKIRISGAKQEGVTQPQAAPATGAKDAK